MVITVPFTQIEEQHYSTMFEQMTEDCGLNLDGTPRVDDWDPDSPATIEKMRSWLTRLRQTCLHPEIGARNRRALGNGKGPLRTVGEVLEVMIEQNDVAARLEERTVCTIPNDPKQTIASRLRREVVLALVFVLRLRYLMTPIIHTDALTPISFCYLRQEGARSLNMPNKARKP